MITCDAIQDHLAEIGAEALKGDEALANHVAGCDACTAFLDDLRRLDAALDDLPEGDASDALVAATLAKVRQADAPRRRLGGASGKRQQIAAAPDQRNIPRAHPVLVGIDADCPSLIDQAMTRGESDPAFGFRQTEQSNDFGRGVDDLCLTWWRHGWCFALLLPIE